LIWSLMIAVSFFFGGIFLGFLYGYWARSSRPG
jgi:hypothetical protein